MRTAPLFLACVLLVGSTPVRADPAPPKPRLTLRFEYTRGARTESCPDAHTTHDILMGYLGYDPVKPDGGARIQVSVTREGSAFHSEITIEDAAGKLVWVEEFGKRSQGRCIDLMRKTVLAAVIAAEQFLPNGSPAPVPAPPEPPGPPSHAAPPTPPPVPVSTARASPSAPPPAAPPPAPWRFEVGAGPLVNVWLTPGLFSMGAVAFFTARRADFSITGELRGMRSIVPDKGRDHPALRGEFYGGAAGPCYYHSVLFVCGVLTLGALQGSGYDIIYQVKTHDPIVFAIGGRGGIEWSFAKRLVLRGYGEVMGILTKTTFVYNEGEVWRTGQGFLSIGLASAVSW